MTNRELFNALFKAASGVYDQREAASVARFIAERVYGIDRMAIAVSPDVEVRAIGFEKVLNDIAAGRPAQYIAGGCEFCGLEFAVAEGALIPRQETQELVEWIAAETAAGAAVLDIGTGSGAIAVALAKMIAGSEVYAVDISPEALRIARKNAERNGVRVAFEEFDILGEGAEILWQTGFFDVIASNPPYIPLGDRPSMHMNVTGYEPREALFVPDADPLVFYRAIAQKGRTLLKQGGRLYFEIYEHAAAAVCGLLAEAGYSDVEVRRDINGRDRMIKTVKR